MGNKRGNRGDYSVDRRADIRLDCALEAVRRAGPAWGPRHCLASGTCFLQFEELDAPEAWLDEIEASSSLAVLHWDRGIPWLAFDPDPPTGADREAFYDARLDAATVAWLGAYAAHFQSMGKGYLAVSVLDGSRSGYAPLHLGVGDSVPVGSSCPVDGDA